MKYPDARQLFCAILCVLIVTAVAPPAVAQNAKAPVIVVINYVQALQQSAAGKIVREQVDKQRAIYQVEIKAIQTKLEEARAELAKQQQILAPEIFARKRQEFQQQAGQLQRTAQSRKRQLDLMRNKGYAEVKKALRQVLEEIAKERGYDIILNADPGANTVVLAGKEHFITEEAIKRLDKKLPTVTVKPALE
jgi:Skp family chaperone for outer membrane proteins